jgi:hypothetical protein
LVGHLRLVGQDDRGRPSETVNEVIAEVSA